VKQSSAADLRLDLGMPMTITPEQRLAVTEAGDKPVELADPQTGDTFILIRAAVYRKMQELLAEEEARREEDAWSKVARKARDQWARENPY
jgi:hypothetical protein